MPAPGAKLVVSTTSVSPSQRPRESPSHSLTFFATCGVPSIPMSHESRFACYILNAILGGGMSSRLFQNIREKQGLAYTVYSELTMYRDAGCMLVYAGTSQKTAGKVIESVVHELGEIASHKVTPEELRRAKDHLKGSYVLGLESTSSRMGNLARQELYFKRFFSILKQTVVHSKI